MKRGFSISTLGGSALMLIFASLCLTVFALLSLSTAKAGDSLSEGSMCAAESFYRADTEAEQILAALRRGEIMENVEQDGTVYRFSCPIDDRQSLYVEVEWNGTDYEILRWQAMIDDSMIEDNVFDLWDGTFFEP